MEFCLLVISMLFLARNSAQAKQIEFAGNAAISPLTIPTGTDRMVVIKPHNRLGNVLRHVSSWVIISRHFNARVALNLTLAAAPTCVYYQLFSRLTLDYDEAVDGRSPCCPLVPESFLYSFNITHGFRSTNTHIFVEAEVAALPPGQFSVSSIYAAKPLEMPVRDYIKSKVAFYSTLDVPVILTKKADAFQRRHSTFVGMHIRATDNLSIDHANKRPYLTPLPAFVAQLAELLGAGGTVLLITDNLTRYVAGW